MGEHERKIIGTIAEALPKMNDFEKGYFLGVAESRAADTEKQAEKAAAGETPEK